ncbi:MAG: DUF5722 domain-containing protein [Rubripirellula sp.]|jgi:hypothetical protein
MHEYNLTTATHTTYRKKSVAIVNCLTVLFCIFAQHSFCRLNVLKADQPQSITVPDKPLRTNQIVLVRQDGSLSITTTGNDPFIMWEWRTPLLLSEPVLSFEYFCPDGIENVSLFIGPPISSKMQLSLPNLPVAEGWREYAVPIHPPKGRKLPNNITQIRLDLGLRPDRKLLIRNIKIRPPTQRERDFAADRIRLEKQKEISAKAIREYAAASFPAKFTKVLIEKDTITLAGQMLQMSNDRPEVSVQLVEFPPDVQINEAGITLPSLLNLKKNQFSVVLPRRVGSRDRLYSGWRIKATKRQDERDAFLSARHFANEFKTNNFTANAPLRPENQKGLSGFSSRGPKSDLHELGIKAVTINLVLHRFISTSDGPGREEIPSAGPPIYFNASAFTALDRLVDHCRQHNIIVTAIVLIPRTKRSEIHAVLQHPESEGGVYTMPNMSTSRGTTIYGYLLSRIAKRYSKPNQAPGVITNWIAHNEVDYHPVWTNMGKQPDEIYLETYYRSMRMIHNSARAFNPHARVFISLTHNWNVINPKRWEQLSPKQALLALQRYSSQEGDFAWGVAYHPYPQSLFAKTAWQDTNIENHFDSPLITIQNLHVLGDFLNQTSMKQSNGKRRGVLLSEQGFHTPTYEVADQNRQAGSLHYAMQKIRKFPWIESFHYHRWVDHPDEGGLKLGLRTLPTQDHPHGERKRAWTVYQAINTGDEKRETTGLPKP